MSAVQNVCTMGCCSSKPPSEEKLGGVQWRQWLADLSSDDAARRIVAQRQWEQHFGGEDGAATALERTLEMYGEKFVTSLLYGSLKKPETLQSVKESELLVIASDSRLCAAFVSTAGRLQEAAGVFLASSQDLAVRLASGTLLLACYGAESSATAQQLREVDFPSSLAELLGRQLEHAPLRGMAASLLKVACSCPDDAIRVTVASSSPAVPALLRCVRRWEDDPQVALHCANALMAIAQTSGECITALISHGAFLALGDAVGSLARSGSAPGGLGVVPVQLLSLCVATLSTLERREARDVMVVSGCIGSLLTVLHQQGAHQRWGAAQQLQGRRLGPPSDAQWASGCVHEPDLALEARAAWEAKQVSGASAAARRIVTVLAGSRATAEAGVWSKFQQQTTDASVQALLAVSLLERAIAAARSLSVGQTLPLFDRLLDLVLCRDVQATAAARRRAAPLLWRAMHTVARNAWSVVTGAGSGQRLGSSRSFRASAQGGPPVSPASPGDGDSVFSVADTVMSHATTTDPQVLKARSLYVFRLLWEEGMFTGDCTQPEEEVGGNQGEVATHSSTSLPPVVSSILDSVSEITSQLATRRRGTVRFDEVSTESAQPPPPLAPRGSETPTRPVTQPPSPARQPQRAGPAPQARIWQEEPPTMVFLLAVVAEALCDVAPVQLAAPQAPLSAEKAASEAPATALAGNPLLASPSTFATPHSAASPQSPIRQPSMSRSASLTQEGWPTILHNAEQARQARRLLGHGTLWLVAFCQRQVEAPASVSIRTAVLEAEAGRCGANLEAAAATKRLGPRTLGVQWKPWQVPLLARFLRSEVPEVSAFGAVCALDALSPHVNQTRTQALLQSHRSAPSGASDGASNLPNSSPPELQPSPSVPRVPVPPLSSPPPPVRWGSSSAPPPPSGRSAARSPFAAAVANLDSIRMPSSRSTTSALEESTDTGNGAGQAEAREAKPPWASQLLEVVPHNGEDAGAWARLRLADLSAVPWALREPGRAVQGSIASALPSSLHLQEQWLSDLQTAQEASKLHCGRMVAAFVDEGATDALQAASRALRGADCAVTGFAAAVSGAVTEARVAMRSIAGQQRHAGAASSGEGQGAPSGPPRDTTREVVSPFAVAAEMVQLRAAEEWK